MAQWNVNNLNLNDQTGILTIGQGHVLLNYLSLILTPPGPGGGLYSINIHQLSLLALAVSKKDGALEPNPIDQVTLGHHKFVRYFRLGRPENHKDD